MADQKLVFQNINLLKSSAWGNSYVKFSVELISCTAVTMNQLAKKTSESEKGGIGSLICKKLLSTALKEK